MPGEVDHDRVAGGGRRARPAPGWRSPRAGGRARPRSPRRGPRSRPCRPRGPCHSPSSAFGRTPTSIVNAQLLALGGQLADVELRVADRGDAGLEQRPLVPLGQPVAKRLLDDRLAADPLDHQLRRHLALAKAGHLHLAGERRRGAVDALGERLGLDRDVDLDPRLGELCDLGLHQGLRSLVATTLRPVDPGRTAIGTWSGGRFMHFGEPIDDERLIALLRPGDGIDTVITADVYGAGEADAMLGRALEGVDRDSYSPGRRRRPRLRRRRARRAARLSPVHRPAPARARRVRLLPAPRDRGEPRADRRRRASTCCCSTTPTAPASPPRRSGTGWRRCATPA